MSQTGPFGRFLPGATTPTLVFERQLAVPVEAAWRLITDPAALAVWLLADVTIEPHSGGTITMRFNNTDSFVCGRVVMFEPPHVLEYTWPEASAGGSVVRFELSPVGAGTRLVLRHMLEGPSPLEEFGAGWHVHLDLLQDLIADRPGAWPSARWQELRAAYSERRAQAAATVLVTAQGGSMDHPQLTQAPISDTGMLIRRPVDEVFEAMIDPEITTKFWFSRSSGRLEAGKQVRWEWEMYDVSVPVTAMAIEPNRRIAIEWPGYSAPTVVEWIFTPHTLDTTFVAVTERGFVGDGDELVKQVAASTQGFALMLAGLKAWLEHQIRLNLVADRYPEGLGQH